MEIFNSGRTGYEEIVSYGPKWWTEYQEMDAVYRYEGWCLDLMYHLMDRLVKNLFPTQADKDAIEVFERILKIEYDSDMTLEVRRRVVSAYYSGAGHLSRSVILALVKAYTGHDGRVEWDGYTLVVSFNNDDGEYISIGLLQKTIYRRIPAHIGFRTRCIATVVLGINTSINTWKQSYVPAGTTPMTSVGLCITENNVTLETEVKAIKTMHPMTGNSGNTGTYPMVSTGLVITNDEVDMEAETKDTKITYPLSGASGNAGVYPVVSKGMQIIDRNINLEASGKGEKTEYPVSGTRPIQNTGLEMSESNVIPDISTDIWPVTYAVCGDPYDL